RPPRIMETVPKEAKRMRNLLALLGAAVVAFAAVGWYLDWYHVSSTPASAGHRNVNIDLNSGKILDDVNKGVKKDEDKVQGSLDKSAADPSLPAAIRSTASNPSFPVVPPDPPRQSGGNNLFLPDYS